MKKINLGLLGVVSILAACSFVSLNPAAKDIGVAYTKADISQCKFLGNATVSIWSKSSTFQSQGTVEEQLDTLARNEAATMHGNLVFPVGDIDNGRRTYGIYNCSEHKSN